jgi:hypothetical protein
MVKKMFIPSWVFEIAIMRTASEYLSSEVGIEAFGKKYSHGLAAIYKETVPPEVFVETAQQILEFLAEIEAGEESVNLLNNFCYFRLYNEGVNRPRKMKSMFGTIEDAVKTKEANPQETQRSFRAYVFGLRSDTVSKAPSGWSLEKDDHINKLKPLLEESVSLLDLF